MFENQYVKGNKYVHLLEEMNDTLIEIDNQIHNEDYTHALKDAFYLHDIVVSHFTRYHIFRGITHARVGFLLYVHGIYKASRDHLIKAKIIFEKTGEGYALDLFEVNHILYKLSSLKNDDKEFIEYGQALLNDPLINDKLQVRIYLKFAQEYLFSKDKNLELMYHYTIKAKAILEIMNQIEGTEYADVLFLLANYYKETNENDLALSFIAELNSLISKDKLPGKKAYSLRRSTDYLKKVIKKEEQDINELSTIETIEFLILDDDHVN